MNVVRSYLPETNASVPADIAATIVDPTAYSKVTPVDDAFAWLRSEAPFAKAELPNFDPFWIASKHRDVMEIETRADVFRNGTGSANLVEKEAIRRVRAAVGEPNLIHSIVSTDGLEHKKLRAIAFPAFTPAAVRKLEDKVRQIAREFVDRMLSMDGSCDFAKDVALLYPLRVIMSLLGVPQEDEPFMLKLTQELFGVADPEMNRTGKVMDPQERVAALKAGMEDLEAYFSEVTRRCRARPDESVNSLIANAQIDGEFLNHRQLMGYYIIAATAGHDTTSNTTAAAFAQLAEHGDAFAALKRDMTHMPQFLEESIRWATPVKSFMRTAERDVDFAGQQIRAGDWILLSYHSANRDEDVFEDPFRFDITRKPNKHIGFGSGVHVCLGQHLARLEMRTLWEELLPRLKSVELTGPVEMTVSNFVCGPKRVPVRFSAC